MKRLLFIKHFEQYEFLQKECHELLRTAEIVTLSAAAYIALQKAGRDCYAAPEFLSLQDLREIPNEARRLSRLWYEPIGETMIFEGLNLGELVRIENIWFFREMIAADRIAKHIAEKVQPAKAYLFAEGRVPCLRSHRVRPAHDVCEAVLLDSLLRTGVHTHNLAAAPSRGRFPFLPVAFKRRARNLLHSLKNFHSLSDSSSTGNPQLLAPGREFPALIGRRLLLAIGEEVDLLGLAPLVELLNLTTGYAARLINTDSEILHTTTRSGLETVAAEQVFSLQEADSLVMDRGIVKRMTTVQRAFEAARRARNYGHDTILNNRLLNFHFAAIYSSFLKTLIPHILRVKALLRATNPDGVIVAGVEQAKDRATVKIAKQLGILTIGVPHGYLGDADAYEFETDYFLAWGEASRQCLIEEFGKEPEAIKIFSPIHLNRLVPTPRCAARPASGRRLLALTSRTAPVCCDAFDWKTFEHVWKAILSVVETSPEVELIIKPHPGGADAIHYYENLTKRLPPGRVRLETTGRLEALANDVDAVVAVCDASTAILVAQRLRLPTLFIRAGWRVMPWAVRAWGLPDGVESVDVVSDIAPALTRLLFDEEFRHRSKERGIKLLRDNLAPYGVGGAESALLSVIDRCFQVQDQTALSAAEGQLIGN